MAFITPNGQLLEIEVLIDTSLADPAVVIEALVASVEGDLLEADVAAAYSVLREWTPADIPVGVTYNDDFDPVGVTAMGPVTSQIANWNSVTNQSFSFQFEGATSTFSSSVCSGSSPDGENTVRFSYLLDAGVLASVCTLSDLTTVSGILRLVEFDMLIDGDTDWTLGPTTPSGDYDLHSVVLHELGHALGLGHSASPQAVMYSTFDPGEQRRTLHTDDINGMRALYGQPGTATPTATSTSGNPTATHTQTQTATTQPGNPTATPTRTATPTKTATPPSGTPDPSGDRDPIPLYEGQNLVAGPRGALTSAEEFLSCLNPADIDIVYTYHPGNASTGTPPAWKRYLIRPLVPDWVSYTANGGIGTLTPQNALYIVANKDVPNARFKEFPGDNCN